ncbi:MAG: amidohydrolase family protein [Myxococcales bacterium]|nr:amidohydrolase family protein [Myxococcales bacterium]
MRARALLLVLATLSLACSRTAAQTATDDPATSGNTAGETSSSSSMSDGTGETTAGATETAGVVDGRLLLLDGALPGGAVVDLAIKDGLIVEVGELSPEGAADVIDLSGRFVAPAFIDSHVHLAYRPLPEDLADGGIAAAVDLAAPLGFVRALPAAPRVLTSGPMVTAIGGYPTQSWGANGYGYECADAAAAVAAVDALADAGVDLIKIPITGGVDLPGDAIKAAVERAHARGLKVASHALADAEASAAAGHGVDALAHTPTEALAPASISALAGKAVITTLAAFGGGAPTLQNLAALRSAGATILYGTDFGNTAEAGISRRELELMMDAGLDGEAILAAGTSTPASYWGLDTLGELATGKAASLLVLAEDPLINPLTLAEPVAVLFEGAWRGAPP